VSGKQRRKREKRRRHAPARGSARRRIVASAGLGVTAALGASATAEAANFTVNSTADPGDGTCDGTCTLRDALDDAAANSNPGVVDQILFDASVTGTITLNGTQLPTIDEPLYIDGPGAGALTVSGNNASRILYMDTAAGDDVTVSGLTLSGGRAVPTMTDPATGGAILNLDADLTIRDSTITGNSASGESAAAGGGISTKYNTTIQDSTIANNVAQSTKYDGDAAAFGGGLGTIGDRTTIEGSTISGNDVSAINTGPDMNPMTDHDAQSFAGGLIAFSENGVTIRRSTISGNDALAAAPPGYDAIGTGGGLVAVPPTTIESATVAGNSANAGGGIYAIDEPGIVLANTIVADNSAGTGPDLLSSNAFQAAFSLIEDPAGASINPTAPNVIGSDPQLGPLAENKAGQTLKPAATSPAIDQGSAGTATTDQRGQPRPYDAPSIANAEGGDGTDIGAIELQDSDLAPDTTITKGPKNKVKLKKKKKKKKVTFEFTSSDPGSSFQCAVDDQVLKVPCTSPYKVKVKKGKHDFEVRAIDAAGNIDPTPASDDWKVKKKKKKKKD
jgi:CSLREA domain-containing protein